MFSGLFSLIKLVFRRDRVKLPVWIGCFTLFILYMIPTLQNIYGDAESLGVLSQTFSTNVAMQFLVGPMDGPTFGALFTIETLLWGGLAIAFMNILLIIRHTRHNEEIGAQELIQSCRVGRGASLLAALKVAFLTNLITTVALGFGMTALCDSWGANEAWLYAVTMGLFGMVWATIAAVIAQLVESGRSAIGILSGLVGLAFLVRGVGDFLGKTGADGLIHPSWISYLSPFGWMQAARPLTAPDWLPILIPIIFIMIATPFAFFLLSKRDVGAGLLPSRKGKAHASKFAKTPRGHVWQIQKTTFFGWLAGTSVFALTIGMLIPEMSGVFDTNESAKKVIESLGSNTGDLIPSFLSAMLVLAVIMVAGYTIHGLGKLRHEEANGHVENLLATRLSRTKWLGWHAATVLMGGLAMLALSGIILGVCVNLSADYSVNIWEYVFAAVSYFPFLLAVTGAYLLLFGILPRAAGAILWTYYGFVAFMSWVGPMLGVDQWVMNISILEHFSAPPADSVLVAPLFITSIIAVAIAAIGIHAWRSRDLVEK